MSPKPRHVRPLLGLFAVLLTLPTLRTSGFCLDDAFIHLSYLRSIRLGEGVSYNPNDWETGISSPLWLALLWLWPFGTPSIFGIKLFGALLHAAGAALIDALAHELDPKAPPRFGVVAGLLFAATPLSVQGATSGMEVPLATSLTLALSLATLRQRPWLSALLACLAYLARPELLVYALGLSASLFALRRTPAVLGAAFGALSGMCAYWAYCYVVSGYLWPNTYYVKGGGVHVESLAYLADVLAAQPVLASVAGLVLCGLSLREALQARRRALLAVAAVALTTLLAIALSRTLYPGVLFYQSRYFVPVLWIFSVLCAHGVARLARKFGYTLLAPVAALGCLLLWANVQQQLAQERGIVQLHVKPAVYLSTRVPAVRVLGVEGAGALRYLTPRSIEVVDLMGLNERAIAHTQGGFFAKLCHLQRRGVTHLAYPAQWRADLQRAFVLEDLKRFTERAYAQLDPPAPWQVTVARVLSTRSDFAAFCRSKPGASSP